MGIGASWLGTRADIWDDVRMVAEYEVRALCQSAVYQSKLYNPLEHRKNVLVLFTGRTRWVAVIVCLFLIQVREEVGRGPSPEPDSQ